MSQPNHTSSLGLRVLRNTGFLTAGQVVVTGLNILLIPILANSFGAAEFGRYGLALNVAALVLVFVDFGSRQLIVRQVGRVDSNASRYCVNGLLVKAVLVCVGIGGAVFFASRTYDSGMVRLILLASTAMAAWAITDFLLAFFHSREQMHVAAGVQSGQSVLYATGAIALVTLSGSGAGTVLSWQAACFVGISIVAYFMAARAFQPNWGDVSLGFTRSYVADLWVFGLLFVASQGVIQLPPIVLSFLASDSEVGIYQGAARIILAIEILPRLLSSGAYPVLAKIPSPDSAEWRRLADIWLRSSIVAGVWLATGLALLGSEFSDLVFRAEGYEAVGVNLRLLSFLVLVRFISFPLGMILLTLNKEKWCAFVMAPSAFLAALLARWLVTSYGSLGATASWVATGVFVAFWFAAITYREVPSLFLSRQLRATILMAALVSVIVLASVSVPLVWRIILAVFAPPVLSFLIGAISSNDLRAFRSGLRGLSRNNRGTGTGTS